MVPEGWSELDIGRVSHIVTKGSTPTTHGYAFVSKSADSIRFIGAYNCSTDGKFKTNLDKWISPKADETLKRSKLHSGDSVFCIVGNTIGSSFLVTEDITPANINQNVALIRPICEIVTPDFMHYWLRSSCIQTQVYQDASTQAQPSLSLKQVNGFKIKIPPISEQEEIVKILSIWDRAIAANEQLLENSQQQKKALTRQLLSGNKRLHGFQRAWGKFRLEQLFSRVTTKNTEVNTNVVTMSAQHGLIRQEDFFNKTVASETLDNYFLLKQGQFAYNKSYSNGYPMGAIKRLNKYEKGVVTTLYICFEVSDETNCNSEFFEHYFESGLLNNGLSKVANEGGRAHGLLNVKPSDFFGLTVFVPEADEQKAIAAVLTTADQEIQTLQAKLDCLKQEKKALMQQLLTGKRRVTVDAKEAM